MSWETMAPTPVPRSRTRSPVRAGKPRRARSPMNTAWCSRRATSWGSVGPWMYSFIAVLETANRDPSVFANRRPRYAEIGNTARDEGSPSFFNSCSWPCGPRPRDENGSRVALRCPVDGPSVARSAQPGAASPINSWTPGAPRHDQLSLPSGKHADQTLQARAPRSAVRRRRRNGMEVLYPRCCGLDVHKREVVACLVSIEPDGTVRKEERAFGTMTPDILALADWLAAHEVTHVAMESTGVYWKPLWNLLEERFILLLVNARHVKAVPGRKTDVRDCEWWRSCCDMGC